MIDPTNPSYLAYNHALLTLERIHTLYTTKRGLLSVALKRPGDKEGAWESRMTIRDYAIKEIDLNLRKELRVMRQYFDALESLLNKDDILT